MRFTLPQFIEHELKIFWFFTFKQFVYIGSAAAIIFILYFTLAKTNFLLFLMISVILGGGAISLAFLRVWGRSLPTVLKNVFVFYIAPKFYLWRRKEIPSKIIKRVDKRIETEEASHLKFAERSRLKQLSTEIETQNK